MNVKINIEKFFKIYIFPYLTWYLINKEKLSFRIPSQDDDLYFDGFPRSGNTYTMGLLNHIFEVRYTSHLHSIVGFKIAKFYKIPIITIIREPKDAVPSYLYTKINRNKKPVRRDLEKLISDLLFEYCYYYAYIYQNIDRTYIVNFKSMIDDPEIIILDIEKNFNFRRNFNLEISESINNFSKDLYKKEQKKEVAYSSMPNEERMRFKNNVKILIENNIQYSEANKIYKKIKESCIK